MRKIANAKRKWMWSFVRSCDSDVVLKSGQFSGKCKCVSLLWNNILSCDFIQFELNKQQRDRTCVCFGCCGQVGEMLLFLATLFYSWFLVCWDMIFGNMQDKENRFKIKCDFDQSVVWLLGLSFGYSYSVCRCVAFARINRVIPFVTDATVRDRCCCSLARVYVSCTAFNDIHTKTIVAVAA